MAKKTQPAGEGSKTMTGRYGRYLDVDLSNRTLKEFVIPENWGRKHLGGRGIGAWIMLQELPAGADPLGPENLLVFGTGPLQGTGMAGAGRHVVRATEDGGDGRPCQIPHGSTPAHHIRGL